MFLRALIAADAAGLTVASTTFPPQVEAKSIVATAKDRLKADAFRFCRFRCNCGFIGICSIEEVSIIVLVEVRCYRITVIVKEPCF